MSATAFFVNREKNRGGVRPSRQRFGSILVNTTSRAEKTPKELQALYDYLERDEITEDDPFIKRLHEIVQTTNQSREVRSIMTLAEEMENREAFARERGLKEGLETGMQLAQEKIALKLKASGMNDAEISDITGLSPEEIAALQ